MLVGELDPYCKLYSDATSGTFFTYIIDSNNNGVFDVDFVVDFVEKHTRVDGVDEEAIYTIIDYIGLLTQKYAQKLNLDIGTIDTVKINIVKSCLKITTDFLNDISELE